MRDHLTVIPADSVIVVDGEALSFPFQHPENLHALQWHNEKGHIEYLDGAPNRELAKADYIKEAAPFVVLWQAEKRRLEEMLRRAEEEANKPPTPEEQLAAVTSAIQTHLDSFARARNYDGIMSAATYATSTVPRFKREGQYAVEARDATWSKAYAILDDVVGGKRPMPTLEEVITELPPLAWPA